MHLVLAPGRNIKCDNGCGGFASTFRRCAVGRCMLAWCGNCRPKNIDAAHDEHERRCTAKR